MKIAPLSVIGVLLGMVFLFLAGGCSQQKVQTEVTQPPPPAETATVQPVEKAGRDLSSQPQVTTQPIIAGNIEESSPQVESLDAAPPVKNGPLFDQPVLPVSEGRTSISMLPIYFDFDRSNIKEDQLARIQGNAAAIKKQISVRVRIEGNCDERGTNEYNMALGERRAMSAKKFMVDLGVDETRLDTLSYGEELPLNPGHDEVSWAENRRGDFVIIN